MTSFKNKLADAKSAPPRYADVVVSLDKDSSEKLEALTDELAAAKKSNDDRLGAPTAASVVQEKIDAILAEQVDSLVTLRFTRLPGDEWGAITRLCPPNAGSIIDRHYKYSMDDASKLAAQFVDDKGNRYGHVVEGGELTALTVNPVTEKDPNPVNEWEDIFSLMSGPEFTAVVDTIYGLNVYGPTARLNELVKISASLTA